MAETPWLKFFPQDWMGEPRLRACSLAARGLWMEMIALAHQATPYGHVLINGNTPDVATLSRMVGASESECETLIEELDRNGVFSRTRKGIIYSRRMIRDAKKATHARNIGKKGGNPTLSKQSNIPAKDNPRDKPQVKPQKPEAIYQNPEREEKEDARARDPVKAIFSSWNRLAGQTGLPEAQRATASRIAKASRRWADSGGQAGIDAAIEKIRKSPFLLGRNPRGWKANIDWFLQESSFTKLMEGAYDSATEQPDPDDDFRAGLVASAAELDVRLAGRRRSQGEPWHGGNEAGRGTFDDPADHGGSPGGGDGEILAYFPQRASEKLG